MEIEYKLVIEILLKKITDLEKELAFTKANLIIEKNKEVKQDDIQATERES